MSKCPKCFLTKWTRTKGTSKGNSLGGEWVPWNGRGFPRRMPDQSRQIFPQYAGLDQSCIPVSKSSVMLCKKSFIYWKETGHNPSHWELFGHTAINPKTKLKDCMEKCCVWSLSAGQSEGHNSNKLSLKGRNIQVSLVLNQMDELLFS